MQSLHALIHVEEWKKGASMSPYLSLVGGPCGELEAPDSVSDISLFTKQRGALGWIDDYERLSADRQIVSRKIIMFREERSRPHSG
jgi:hypothetical protein